MSCIETFIPRTKLDKRIDKEFGNDWKRRDTFLALAKSNGFKEWYRKNAGVELDEEGDGRKIFPALRRYYNNKFFSVNDNTTIRKSRGRFTSYNARQLAIDYVVGKISEKYHNGNVTVDTEKEIYDDDGNLMPNPNYGKAYIHHASSKGDLVYRVCNDIYFLTNDMFNNIIIRNLPSSVQRDFQTLAKIIELGVQDDAQYKKTYNLIINKYKTKAAEQGIKIVDAYDLAAVFTTNDKIKKVLKDRYIKVNANNVDRYEYFDIMGKIMLDNSIASIQESNTFAMYSEMPWDSVYQDENGNWVYPDFISDDVFRDSRLSFLNKFKTIDDEIVEPENKELDGEQASDEDGVTPKSESENDNMIYAANMHLGTYDNFMKHADSVVRAYLGSLPNLLSLQTKYIRQDGTPATTEDINNGTEDLIEVLDIDRNNELGVATFMNVSEVMTVLYQYTNKSSASAMRADILRIARDIPGMKGLYKIYKDTDPSNPSSSDILFSLYTTFGKIAFPKSQVEHSSEGVTVKISNEQGMRVNALRMQMLNEFRSTCLSIDDRTAIAELNSIKEIANKYDGTEESRININAKIDEFIHRIFPSLSEGTVFNYIYKDGEKGFKNNAINLIAQLGVVANNIITLNQEYNSLRIAQNEVYSEIGKINYAIKNPNISNNDKKIQELINKRKELKLKLKKLYATDYTTRSQNAIYNLANSIVDYTLVRTDFNSPNIHGDMSSDIINNNMMTNITNLLSNPEALKKYGNWKMLSQQYDFSNILLESIDDEGNIVNFGLFRESVIETVDESTGKIINKTVVEPTEYANKMLQFQLFDGVKNSETGAVVLYSEMTKSDYIVTAINEFFKDTPIDNGRIHTAQYFTRVPSDAPKTFVMRAPKYSTDGLIINGAINTKHPIFQQLRRVVKQEIQDAATAASKFFVIDNSGYVSRVDGDVMSPQFKENWSNDEKDTKRAFDQYHTKNGKIIAPIVNDAGATIGYRLLGNVFHSDRFVISTTQTNYGEKLFGTGTDDGIINILYGRDANGLKISENNGKVTYTLTEQQEQAIDELIKDFINGYVDDCETRIKNSKEYINPEYKDRNHIIDFALNTYLAYVNYNDLLEGDTKFYKSSQEFLKRAKEMQASGVPYGIVDYINRFMPDMSHIPSRLDAANIRTSIDDENPVTLRNGFRAITIKNTVRTSEDARRLFGHYEGKKFIPGSLVTRTHNAKSIINAETAERLYNLYKDTKTNDAQSYITLDEWIRRITARGQFARYEHLIRKLVDPNAEITTEDIDEFVQVQKNYYYDQHYNKELGVTSPRQIKNAEFVLIPRFLTYTVTEKNEEGIPVKVTKDTDLMKVYKLLKKYDIDQVNTVETSKAGKANVLTLWDNDGILTDEAIAEFENDITAERITDNETVEVFSYNNLYLQQDISQHMDTENKAGIQIMKKILDNIQESYNSYGQPKGLYLKKTELMECYCANIKESFDNLMKELDIPVDKNGYPELEYIESPDGVGSYRIKGLSYDKLFKRLKEEAQRTGVNSNVAEFFELDRQGEPLMPPFLGSVSSKLESIIQSVFNNNITRQKLPGFHAAQVTGIGISEKWKGSEGQIKSAKEYNGKKLRYHPIDDNGDITAYVEVIIPKPKELQHLSDEEALRVMEECGSDKFIGYRIPTEGKQSIAVMKVAGFLDKSQGSTIVVADDWVAQTGADFDADSIYAICPHMIFDKKTNKWKIVYNKDTKMGRDNIIVRNMIDILSHPSSIEENLSCSNFKDIINARERVLKGTKVAAQRASRSAYNFFDQADFQEDAMSGARLKGMSVMRDTLCSVCNTVKPYIAKPIIAEYTEYDKNKNPYGVKYQDLVDAGYEVQIINTKEEEPRRFRVKHNRFGWSKNYRNVKGRLITAYSSQTTAHILDAIKEGNIPNVNEFTFGLYKLFPDLGLDYDTAVSFMMLPGVTRIVDKYNAARSVYAEDKIFDEEKINILVANCLKDIAIELGLITDVYTPISKVTAALDSFARKYLDDNGYNNFSFSERHRTAGNIVFNAEKQIEIIKKRNASNTPVEESTSKKVNIYNGNITADDDAIMVFGSNYVSYNGNPDKGTGGAALVALQQGRVEQKEYMGDTISKNGRAYGIGTISRPGAKLSISNAEIINNIKKFYAYANANPSKTFKVAYQETGRTNLNGRTTRDMIKLFIAAGQIPSNVQFHDSVESYFDVLSDNEIEQRIEDAIAICQFQYLYGISQKIGDYAGALNPDKFGAKVSTFSTRKTLNDIRKLATESNPLLYVQNEVTDEDAIAEINRRNEQIEKDNNAEPITQENIDVLNSDKTILSNEELAAWNAQGITGKPRIMVASEHTDPVYFAKYVVDIINGVKSFKDFRGNELSGNDFNGLYIVTKHDGIPIKQILETNIPKLIHFSITSLGGTKYEPGVMKYNDLLDKIQDLIAQGLDPNCVTIRIDPIVPGLTKFEDVEEIVRRASEMGITRIRFSVMDNYPENKTKGTKSTEEYMEALGYDFSKYYEASSSDLYSRNHNGNSKYQKHAKYDIQRAIAEKMLTLVDKYHIKLSTCAEPLTMPGISKEGCLSVDQVNEMLGTNEEDNGTANNKSRALCSCFGNKTDVLAYNQTCPSQCGYCYAGHNTEKAMEYYDENGKLKDNIFTRTRQKKIKQLPIPLSEGNIKKIKTQLQNSRGNKKTNIIASVYPGIDYVYENMNVRETRKADTNENAWIKHYISSTGVSSYPSLNYFLKYATLTSILVEEQVFETESENFRSIINDLSSYIGRNLTEQEYNKFKAYYLTQEVYKHTEFLNDTGELESISENDSYERITGINMPIQFNFTVEDITNPTEKEKEAFRKLTPGQKVLWIKQNSRDAGIFDYLDVNLRNANAASNYSSTHQITFNANAIDEEAALSEMRKAWKNKIWFVKETVRDLLKYSIVTEEYKMSRKGITRIIVNDILRDTKFTDNVSNLVRSDVNFGSTIYEDYIRSHFNELKFPTFTSKKTKPIVFNSLAYNMLIFNLKNEKDLGYRLKVVRKTNDNKYAYPKYATFIDINGEEVQCRGAIVGDFLYYHPINKLMPTEHTKFSVNESYNINASQDFYDEYFEYISFYTQQMNGAVLAVNKNIEDYKFKSTKEQNIQVEEFDINEVAERKSDVKQLLRKINDNARDIDKKGLYVRVPTLAKLRPSTIDGSPLSYTIYDTGSKQYIIKHIDTEVKRGTHSINEYLAEAYGDILDLRENQNINVNLDLYAENYVKNRISPNDKDIEDIVKQAIRSGVKRLDDVFLVMPRKTITMNQSISEIVPEGVVGLKNRRAIGDDDAANAMYALDQAGVDIENIDAITDKSLPVIKSIAEYTKLAVDAFNKKFDEFWRDSNGVVHSIDDPDIVKHLAESNEELSRYSALIGDIRSFISQMSFLTRNNISVEEQPEEFREAIRTIIDNVNKLQNSEKVKKMSKVMLDYFKSQSDDDLLISELYELTDGYQNLGKIESFITDAQEAPIPLMQIILHIATRNVRGDDMKHFKNAKKFRNNVENIIAAAKNAGKSVDMNKIIDENGKLIQAYNDKFVKDYRNFVKQLDDIIKDPRRGKSSLDYIKKKHEFDSWKYRNLHQRYVDDYYMERLGNEAIILDEEHGFPRVYAKYVALTDRRNEILRSIKDGEISKTQQDELDSITNEIDNMTNTFDKEHIYELVDTNISRSEYTQEDKDAEDNSYEAAKALNDFITRSINIKAKYFTRNEIDGFREALQKHLKVIFDSEQPDRNGNPTVPASLLANSPAFEEYRKSKRWVRLNAKLVLSDKFAEILSKAYAALGVADKGRNFDILSKIKAKNARDNTGVVDGTLFTDEEIEEIRDYQQEDIDFNSDGQERLITNGSGSPFVWKLSFWEAMKSNGVNNLEYIATQNNINEILKKCYDPLNKRVEISKLSLEDMQKVGELYHLLMMMHKTTGGGAKDAAIFIEKHTETIPAVNPITGNKVFDEEQAKALALWSEDSEEYKAWLYANTQLVARTVDGITVTTREPNVFLYTTIQPKGAEGTLIRDEDGFIVGFDGNTSFKMWFDFDRTRAQDTLSRFVSKVPTKYYYDRKAEVFRKREGENDEQRQARIDEWIKQNHVYNPYTHTLEPLQIWTMTQYYNANAQMAAITGSSDSDVAEIYHYEARSSQIETEPKDDTINKAFKEGGYIMNFKDSRPETDTTLPFGIENVHPTADRKYINSKYRKLNKYERKVRKEFEDNLKAYAKSSSARRYIQNGTLPAFAKPKESHSASWHAKQMLKGLGWYYQPQGAGPFKENIDYEHDSEPNTPGLKELMDKRSKEFAPKKLRRRSEFPPTAEGTKQYEMANAKIKKENEKRAEERSKISQELMNRDWLSVMERFIVEAGHHNSVQMNKNLIYFGLDYLRNHKAYKVNFGKSTLREDKNSSYGNNVNYEMENYGDDTLAVYEAWARRFIFNEFKKDQGKLTSIANLMQQLSSAKYMMINITGGISNVTYGESQIAMEAFANEYFSPSEWAVGKKLWIQSLTSFAGHLYDDTASDIGDGLCKLFNTLEFDSITELHEDNPGAAVKWQRVRNSAYVLQTLGEHFMQNGALLTMLSSHRLVNRVDRATGKNRYYAWSLDRYIRDAREVAFMSMLSRKEKKDFVEFKNKIKSNPNDAKNYAWRRKDLITEFVLKNFSKERTQQFNAKRKELEAAAEKEFYSLPTLFDQFELKNGYAEFKQGSKKDGIILSNIDENEAYRILGEMKNKVISVNKKIHGVYDKLGASRLEQEWYGGIVMQYHKHIWPGIMKRYRRHGYFNEDRGTVDKGAYHSLLDFLSIPFREQVGIPSESVETMTGIQNMFHQATNFLLNVRMYYDILPAYDRANIRRTIVEIAEFCSAVALATALRLAGDDDDEKDGIPYNMAVYLTDRFLSENQTYTPYGLVGEAKKQWSSPVASWTSITDLLKLMNELSKILLEGDEYEPEYATGRNAGRNKVGTLILRNIPVVRGWDAIWRLPKNNKYYKLQSNDFFVDVAYNALHSTTDD